LNYVKNIWLLLLWTPKYHNIYLSVCNT
jgi:hypothetical protein